MNSPIIYIVDDDDDMRDSLVCLLEASGYTAKGYANAAAFLRDFSPEMTGCLVVDQQMPGMSGLELIQRLHATDPDALPTIFITAYADIPTAVSAIKEGAIEFLEKPFERRTLLEQVERALEQDRDRQQGRAHRKELTDRFARLSERERETIALLREGLPNKTIAARLGVTERAVEMRRASIMRKLGVGSTAELLEDVIQFQLAQEAYGVEG